MTELLVHVLYKGSFGMLGGLLAAARTIIIARDAFEDEIWKGILCVLCGFYMVYYAIAEMVEYRWLAIILYVVGMVMAFVGRSTPIVSY